MDWLFILTPILSSVLFLISFHHNRYRMRCGFLFLVSLFLIQASLFLTADDSSSPAVVVSLAVFVIFAVFCFFGILFFLISLFYNGIVLLRKEGVSFHNALSLFLLIYLLATPIYINNIEWIRSIPVLSIIFVLNAVLTLYLALTAVIYVTSGMLVTLTSEHRPVDYIIVLGCGLLNGNQITPLLAGRVDRAIRLYRKAPDRTVLVMSGGKGGDEMVPESIAMKEYALSKGIPEDHIRTEEQSVNTSENMRFSKALIQQEKQGECRIAYATNRFHQFRAGAYAHEAGMNIRGVGSRTKFYFEQNALIREFAAMLKMDWKVHSILFGTLLIVTLAIALHT